MPAALQLALKIVSGIIALGGLGWLGYYCLSRSEDPPRLVFKWVLTGLIALFLWRVVSPMAERGGGEAWSAVVLTLVCGLILAALWRQSLGAIVSRPFESLYTGGDVQAEPRPAYSAALTRRKQGKYLQAIAEIRAQLDRFPTDFEGQMMVAEIQANDLKDLQGAEITIQRICSQKHAPQNIAYALHSLADWHLKLAQDPEAARRALEQIHALLPNSEFALAASNRIAHLTPVKMAIAQHERRTFAVTPGPQNLGLLRGPPSTKAPEQDPGQTASEYVRHLEQHPLDSDTREKLAVLYADHYRRLDLAADQLEQLISHPQESRHKIVRWLNLLADLQIRSGADAGTVSATLQRIVDLDENAPAAELARNRLGTLKLELKGRQKNQPVRLGTYEQNIGLRRERKAPGA